MKYVKSISLNIDCGLKYIVKLMEITNSKMVEQGTFWGLNNFKGLDPKCVILLPDLFVIIFYWYK